MNSLISQLAADSFSCNEVEHLQVQGEALKAFPWSAAEMGKVARQMRDGLP